MEKITPDIYIEDLVEDYPYLVSVLMKYGIKTMVCGEAVWGTLREYAEEHGVKDLDVILKSVNEIVEERGVEKEKGPKYDRPLFLGGNDS